MADSVADLAAVTLVEVDETAATVDSSAEKAAVQSAVTLIIFAQAAAICQQLGDGPDAFLFTPRDCSEKLVEVDAGTLQVQDDAADDKLVADAPAHVKLMKERFTGLKRHR